MVGKPLIALADEAWDVVVEVLANASVELSDDEREMVEQIVSEIQEQR